jgi:hypothetical protein
MEQGAFDFTQEYIMKALPLDKPTEVNLSGNGALSWAR